MLTALDRRLHLLEDFPTPYHQFPSPHHLGNTETSTISWEVPQASSTNTRELGSTARHTGFHTQRFHGPLIWAPVFQDVGQPGCNLNSCHLW